MPQTHQQLRDSQVHIPTPNAENHFRMALFLRRSFSPKIPTSLLITQAQCNKAQLKIIYLPRVHSISAPFRCRRFIQRNKTTTRSQSCAVVSNCFSLIILLFEEKTSLRFFGNPISARNLLTWASGCLI